MFNPLSPASRFFTPADPLLVACAVCACEHEPARPHASRHVCDGCLEADDIERGTTFANTGTTLREAA